MFTKAAPENDPAEHPRYLYYVRQDESIPFDMESKPEIQPVFVLVN